jgi:hypothetical protein
MDDYIGNVCGRVIQSNGPLRYAIVDGMPARPVPGIPVNQIVFETTARHKNQNQG